MPDELGVVPLAAPPPSVAVLDTSAVVCALLGDQPQHEAYADFLARAISAGTALVGRNPLRQADLHPDHLSRNVPRNG